MEPPRHLAVINISKPAWQFLNQKNISNHCQIILGCELPESSYCHPITPRPWIKQNVLNKIKTLGKLRRSTIPLSKNKLSLIAAGKIFISSSFTRWLENWSVDDDMKMSVGDRSWSCPVSNPGSLMMRTVASMQQFTARTSGLWCRHWRLRAWNLRPGELETSGAWVES